ncbi:MAG: hypothetical protein Kow0099_29040 [Candidatus Abyssubacteria bacterium]
MPKEHDRILISDVDFDAVIFDLDGVVTKTAKTHAAVWKRLFDEYLEERARQEGSPFRPFDDNTDYRTYVDGKPRYDGVKSFLESRGIHLPYGSPDDPPDRETICGLGNKKNLMFHEYLRQHGVDVYDFAIELIKKLRSQGFKTAIVSSSKNCVPVLEAAGALDLFDVKVDGVDSASLELDGKPAPDIFLEAARRLGVPPERAVVVEDAISGVQAGRRGRFGFVLGVNRTGHAKELSNQGADAVVPNLSKVLVVSGIKPKETARLPSALASLHEIEQQIAKKTLAVFLDYDGTLTPIVDTPDKAILSEEMRSTVTRLSTLCTVAVISGRDLADVKKLVGIDTIVYAGSHGFDIAGPQGLDIKSQQGTDFLSSLEQLEKALREQLDKVKGALVERKKFSIAVHYRLVDEQDVKTVEHIVDETLSRYPRIRKTYGKKVFDLQPNIDWNKGKALGWLLDALKLEGPDAFPIYIGDDVTDEDAFKALKRRVIGIVVADEPRLSVADYTLRDPAEVKQFLAALISMRKGES